MVFELRERGMNVVSEQRIPIRYKSLTLDGNYRIDLLVDDTIIVELKSVEIVLPVHHAQVLSYLRHQKTARPAYEFQRRCAQRRRTTNQERLLTGHRRRADRRAERRTLANNKSVER